MPNARGFARCPVVAKILVIDDEESVCWAFEKFLKGEGHEVAAAASAQEGFSRLDETDAEIVFLDVRLPGMDGLSALGEIRRRHPGTYVVVITAHGTMDTAIEAVQRGAFDYLTKPVGLSEVRDVIARILASREHMDDIAQLPSWNDSARGEILVGNSPAMQKIYKKIGAVAATDVSVLVEGESGSGKELVARAIHRASGRRAGPFVVVVCGALPESLLESELFGHIKGAFTGASSDQVGKFQKAHTGTLFLDEVGVTSLSAQVKLLRFLQDREFERLGSSETLSVDTRIIAASNEPLLDKAKAGEFREDLYYRLNVVHIELPALRSRKEDIPLLAAYFLSRMAAGKNLQLSRAALDVLERCDWPGNVRELRNALEHAAALSQGGPVLPSHLPQHLHGAGQAHFSQNVRDMVREALARGPGRANAYDRVMAVWEEPLIREALEAHGGNQVAAASFLGISRSTLRKKMAQYGLSGPGT